MKVSVDVRLTGHKAILLKSLRDEGNHGDKWFVPAGFWTDFATVPRLLQSIVQQLGRWTVPAIWHDFDCVSLAQRYDGRYAAAFQRLGCKPSPISSVDADGMFRLRLERWGVPFVKRWLMWTAVRWAALFSDYRRARWWVTAPDVLAITILVGLVVTGAVLGTAWVIAWAMGWL